MRGGIGIDIAELFRRAFASQMLDVFTVEPCIVESYDGETRTVDLRPAVHRALPTEDGDTFPEELPIVPNVPVLFWQAGTTLVTFKLAKGDEGVLFVASSATGAFRESGQPGPPGDLRRHALGAGFFLPAGLSKAKVTGTQGNEDALIFTADEIRLGSQNPVDFVALANKVNARLDALQTAFNSHVHSGVTTGPGATGAPSPTVSGTNDVGSDKLLAE